MEDRGRPTWRAEIIPDDFSHGGGVKKRRDVSKVGRIAEGGKVARSHSSSSVKTTRTARGEGEKEEDHFVIRLTSD